MRSSFPLALAMIFTLAFKAAAGPTEVVAPLYMPMSVAMKLNDRKGKDELKITRDQEKGIAASLDKWRESYGVDLDAGHKMTGPDKEAKIMAQNSKQSAELFQSLAQTLRPEQIKRLKQILAQEKGVNVFKTREV